jgi:hypothetical protein
LAISKLIIDKFELLIFLLSDNPEQGSSDGCDLRARSVIFFTTRTTAMTTLEEQHLAKHRSPTTISKSNAVDAALINPTNPTLFHNFARF